MGGYVALAIRREAPDRFVGLALLDNTSARPDTAEQTERRRLIAVAKAGHFETTPRCGHLSPLERPRAVGAALAGWLDRMA